MNKADKLLIAILLVSIIFNISAGYHESGGGKLVGVVFFPVVFLSPIWMLLAFKGKNTFGYILLLITGLILASEIIFGYYWLPPPHGTNWPYSWVNPSFRSAVHYSISVGETIALIVIWIVAFVLFRKNKTKKT